MEQSYHRLDGLAARHAGHFSDHNLAAPALAVALDTPLQKAPARHGRTRGLFMGAATVVVLWYGSLLLHLAQPAVYRVVAAMQSVETPSAAIVVPTNSLWYPNLGIRAPLTLLAHQSPLVVQDWPAIRQSLQSGVALMFPTAAWNESSFSFLVGHSSDTWPHPYASVFAALGQARVNDLFYLNVQNTTLTYQVDGQHIVRPNDLAYWQQLGAPSTNGIRHIALVTCWPILTTKNRLVITAHELQ